MTKRSALTNKIKLRYGTKSVQKNYYEEQPEMEEVVVTDEPQKLVWDPDDYIVHPYQVWVLLSTYLYCYVFSLTKSSPP